MKPLSIVLAALAGLGGGLAVALLARRTNRTVPGVRATSEGLDSTRFYVLLDVEGDPIFIDTKTSREFGFVADEVPPSRYGKIVQLIAEAGPGMISRPLGYYERDASSIASPVALPSEVNS